MKSFTKKSLSIIVATLIASSTALAEEDTTSTSVTVEEIPIQSVQMPAAANNANDASLPPLSSEMTENETFLIPNAPTLKPTNVITIRAIGLGVAPESATNKAHGMALAKRSAIIDAYRQMGEKLHGIKINARDTVKDAILKSSIVRTELYSIVRGGEIMETVYNDGLCQVEMEIKIDGRRWYKALTSAF